jgi:hypothetical protein
MRPILYLTVFALLFGSCTESPEQENLPSGELRDFLEKTKRLVKDRNGSPVETISPARDFIALEPLEITMGDDGSVYLKDFEIKTEEDFPSKELISELKERKALRNQMIANGSKSVEEASLRLTISLAQNRSPEVRFTYAKVLEVCKEAGFVIHSIEEKEVILLDHEHIELLKTD